MGYTKAGSVPSLVGGVVAGGALVGAGAIITKGDDFTGHALGAATGWAISAGMGKRFIASGMKGMPAGAATAVGLLAAVYNSKKASDWM